MYLHVRVWCAHMHTHMHTRVSMCAYILVCTHRVCIVCLHMCRYVSMHVPAEPHRVCLVLIPQWLPPSPGSCLAAEVMLALGSS